MFRPSVRHTTGPRAGVRTAVAVTALVVASLTAVASPAAASSAHPAHRFARDRGFDQVDLVSDQQGKAQLRDSNLVNAWGMSQGPTTPLWVSANGGDVSTVYAGGGAGQKIMAARGPVKIPGGAPTGQVFNPTHGFMLKDGAPAQFVFAGEDGVLSAWNRQLTDPDSAVPVASVKSAIFKGIALQDGPFGPRLLVADFGNGRIDVFDRAFTPVKLHPGAFTDRRLPAGFEPFNVAVIGHRVFVTYALRSGEDDVKGPGNGFVDIFNADGTLLQRFASRGVLNSPWALAVAPEHFGVFSGDLLIGNFGDGRIHAFDPRNGRLVGTLRHADGSAIEIDGLWGLLPGNGTSAGRNDLWFTAGPGDESHGLLGVLRAHDH